MILQKNNPVKRYSRLWYMGNIGNCFNKESRAPEGTAFNKIYLGGVSKLIFIMSHTGKNNKVFIFVKVIYEPVGVRNPSAPNLTIF